VQDEARLRHGRPERQPERGSDEKQGDCVFRSMLITRFAPS
jgi:hypothetical protein